ncbi:hypothetical protein N657DRAFT_623053 [Parathielavia appendiculata]|uniref:Zn(2)-C6 fungal-type domain-containing protein n=1 Tax=Parathielavia appendiculata TaxID=2587402 RepID=A0AAN6TXG7_9PEZI|nr:hypothetical protein N657DRAFT_623053 [Parathielavia appendiculata]
MDSARQRRPTSRPRNPSCARSQPTAPRTWDEAPVTVTIPSYSNRRHITAARDAASRMTPQGTCTPGASFSGSSRLRAPDSQATAPPAAAMEAVASSDRGKGARAAPSPSPVAGKSKRVRTGCLTCRERHLKCDEGAPECSKCRRSNRECRRGIRLNFIDIQVRGSPCLPSTADWSVHILDESRVIASEYQGGLGRYPSVTVSPEAHSEVNGSGDPPGGLYHPSHVGHPPLLAAVAFADGRSLRTASIRGLSVTAQAAPGSPLGVTESAGHSRSGPLNARNPDDLGAASPPAQNAASPAPNFHASGSHDTSQHFATTASLMTPPSEDSTSERDYLNTDEEIHFMQVFVNEVAIWMDALDKDKHFTNVVPYLALKLPMLLNALLACGARHLTLTGGHDGGKAEYYYGIAAAQLSRSQQERDCNLPQCTLTAVVLNAYDVMSEPTQRTGRIAPARALVRDCGWDASSAGLGAACFWLNAGMDVLACLSFGWPTAWDPDEWGLDLDFANMGAELWVHRIFYILAKVANFRVNTPRFQEPSPHDEQVRLQNRFAEWRRLQNMCNAWNLNCPRSMRPYGYSPGPSSKSLFPNVWYVSSQAYLTFPFSPFPSYIHGH